MNSSLKNEAKIEKNNNGRINYCASQDYKLSADGSKVYTYKNNRKKSYKKSILNLTLGLSYDVSTSVST